MKSFLLGVSYFFIASSALGGPKVGNGGDPRVAEFLSASQEVCKWIGKDVVLKDFEIACFEEWNDLSASLNLKSRKARIYSTAESVQDAKGVEKDAVTDPATRTIIISAQLWATNSISQKRMTAAMELLLLIGIPNRYEHAQRFLKSMQAVAITAPEENLCKATMDTMSALIDAYITGLKLCYSLETSGMATSVDYQEQVRMVERLEALYESSSAVCSQHCGKQAFCPKTPLTGACKLRTR